MNTWTYDLASEVDPLLRTAIHGLWRYLRYGGQGKSDTLSWTLTDTTVEINWASVSDLNSLMQRMCGDMPDGIMIPPGYPSDRCMQTIYASVLAHKGITQHFFAKRGAARTRSLSLPDKVDPAEAPWSTEDKERRIVLSFTRHALYEDTPSLDVNVKGKFEERQPVGTVYHPMVSQWNGVINKVDPQTKLALAFSCLAFVFTQDRAGEAPFGIGIDMPTFSAADALHRLWIEQPLLRAPTASSAALGIASLLDLPANTYVQISAQGSSFVAFAPQDREKLYPLLLAGMGTYENLRAVALLDHVEINKKFSGADAYTQIIKNIRIGRAWYADVLPVDINFSTRKLMTSIFNTRSTDMEKRIAKRMHQIKGALAAQFTQLYNTDKSKGYERASVFLMTHLTRARNRPNLLKAIAQITKKANRGFDGEELQWILERTERHCSEVQSLLILACTTFMKANTTDPSSDEELETDISI